VRIGLIGYRDLGDAYVTRRYQLTSDIDDVYRRLRRFRADGGGDTPEHVNRALAEAIRRMKWRQGQNVLKMIFLVGNAPPHEGRSGLYSARLAREATRKGIVINAVRCGRMSATARAWRRISSVSGGMYASIRQDGAMIAFRTPVDKKLADLNRKLTATALFAGKKAERAAATRRAMGNMAMDPLAQAESATYRARSRHLDSKDLVTQMRRGRKLATVAPSALPAPMRKMSASERNVYVAKVANKRAKLRRQILKLATKRDAYIKRARKAKPRARAFDDAIGGALKAQGSRANIAY